MLERIKIVLVGTSHSGNIGSVARAMKTMGLSRLCLVQPQAEIDGHAYALAAGASELLSSAEQFDSLAPAVADCGLVVGASARSRTLSWPMLEPRACGELAIAEAAQHEVALVFGRENNGLTNEELQLCNYHVCIPANPDYSSLNLAMAVQIVAYETRVAYLAGQQAGAEAADIKYPSSAQMENFYQHLEQTLDETGFIVRQHPGLVMTKLKRMFNRARPEEAEYNILRGILTSIQKRIKAASSEQGQR
ncbi:MAG: tRNA (cytosine(32)/uridine(32)-2'-O)-methyltransferase TrmJ [Alkalimonas sp.]|nr:tRNA (cytosine(32)/uridine(32)-2'-O)-methyltransferase TrmJ [Alkalimonas sp.]